MRRNEDVKGGKAWGGRGRKETWGRESGGGGGEGTEKILLEGGRVWIEGKGVGGEA